ncbi:MAG: TIGR04211 family SH3 domain-containing protein [Thiohalophilus sp.]|uniref:TIGR04211 family SH3 domain-containing protein n=1 Tax=Thiohalophilus sp. TaxID=3028392 RepID=UPI00286FFCBA|nr:TIGR04211 family SH3 domain-containing protein [Thiohalophilus sp.]MDR9435339.1 TIGR04211 family SH3 domain-containing protein [Thiohalophilus sp.]
MKTIFRFTCLVLLLAGPPLSQAATEYVTDRIEIGVHQQPDMNSPITTKLSSGDSVEVLQVRDDFKQVQLKDGNRGWVPATYLVDRQPATVEYDLLAKKHEELSSEIKQKTERLSKVERDLQIRRDELSNARTTIRELKKQIDAGGDSEALNEENLQQLAEKERQIERLQAEIETLREQSEQATPDPPGVEQYRAQLEQQKERNEALQARIDLAQEFLGREQLPSAEELEKWRPDLPGWYWGTLLTVLIIGIVAGIGWMDFRLRRRHGGFRI